MYLHLMVTQTREKFNSIDTIAQQAWGAKYWMIYAGEKPASWYFWYNCKINVLRKHKCFIFSNISVATNS
jgi:hypothetical protein